MTAAHRWLAALLLLYSVMSYVDRTLLSVAAPAVIREFRLSETQMGFVFSAFQLSYTLMMVPCGRWADRFGPHAVLTTMGLGAGAFTMLMAASPALGVAIGLVPAMALLRFLFGAFTAPMYPSAGRMNASRIPAAHRNLVQGIVNSGAGLGGALSPLLFAWMMAAFGWRLSFAVAGAITMALGLLWHFTVPRWDRPANSPQQPGAGAFGPLLRNRTLQLLTLGFAAIDYFEYIFFYWLYYYLAEIRKVPAAEMPYWGAMPFVAWVVMMPLGGRIADWAVRRFGVLTGYRAMVVACLTASIAAMVAALQSDNIPVTVTLLSLAFGFCAVADLMFWGATIATTGANVATACSIMNMGGNVGGSLAPVVTPMLAASYGWSAGLYAGAAVAVIGILVWLFIRPEET